MAGRSGIQLGFGEGCVLGKTKKLGHYRILDKLFRVVLKVGGQLVHFVDDRLLVLGLQQAEVVLGSDVAVQGAGAPWLAL